MMLSIWNALSAKEACKLRASIPSFKGILPVEGQTSEEQKWKTQRAVEARSRYQLGLKYARLRDKAALAPEKREILNLQEGDY